MQIFTLILKGIIEATEAIETIEVLNFILIVPGLPLPIKLYLYLINK